MHNYNGLHIYTNTIHYILVTIHLLLINTGEQIFPSGYV